MSIRRTITPAKYTALMAYKATGRGKVGLLVKELDSNSTGYCYSKYIIIWMNFNFHAEKVSHTAGAKKERLRRPPLK